MQKTKTAISIDVELLNEANQIAEELEISRSQIISDALVFYVQQYRNKKLLRQINEACASYLDDDDRGTLKLIGSHRKSIGDREAWK